MSKRSFVSGAVGVVLGAVAFGLLLQTQTRGAESEANQIKIAAGLATYNLMNNKNDSGFVDLTEYGFSEPPKVVISQYADNRNYMLVANTIQVTATSFEWSVETVTSRPITLKGQVAWIAVGN